MKFDDVVGDFAEPLRIANLATPGFRGWRRAYHFNSKIAVDTYFDEFLGMVRLAIDGEDNPNGHAIQRALNRGLKDGLRFGANELTLTAIHRSIAAATGRPVPDEGEPTP